MTHTPQAPSSFSSSWLVLQPSSEYSSHSLMPPKSVTYLVERFHSFEAFTETHTRPRNIFSGDVDILEGFELG